MPRPAPRAPQKHSARAPQTSRKRRPSSRPPFPAHPELLTPDLAQAQAFYTAMFGWQFATVPVPTGSLPFVRVTPETGPAVGIWQQPQNTAPRWCLFLNVDNLRAAVARAKKLGATILQARVPVKPYGAYARLQDPTGAEFCVFCPNSSRKGRTKRSARM